MKNNNNINVYRCDCLCSDYTYKDVNDNIVGLCDKHSVSKKLIYTLAVKPINIHWIRTGSQSYYI